MTVGVADLTGVRAKLRRAKEHHSALITEWNIWGKQQANLCLCYIRRDESWYVVMVQPFPQPDIRFAIIAGDLIHNLRSALDFLVWQLVLREGHEPSRRNEFPIYESEEKFFHEVKSRKRKPELGILYGIAVNGDAWTIIEKAQPYHRIPSLLAAIGHLSNTDKHRTLFSQIPFPGYGAISNAIGWNPQAILLEQRQPTRVSSLSLKQDTEIVRFRFADHPDPNVHMKGNFPIEPTLGEGEIKDGYQVGMGNFGNLIILVTNIADEISKLPRVIDVKH